MKPSCPERRANHLVSPSYVSGAWLLFRLGFLQTDPQAITSVTLKADAEFHGRSGTYRYQKIPLLAFFGYGKHPETKALLAFPEKALLDFLWLHRHEDPLSLGLQNLDALNWQKLDHWAHQWNETTLFERILPKLHESQPTALPRE